MNIGESTRQYERWLGQRLPLVPRDLRLKHQRMQSDASLFLRASFYRWAQIWPALCPQLATAPRVLAVGDLHVENFGTWRDEEGRLIWGVNDFDEAGTFPYANDLVRLCTSALLAIDGSRLGTSKRQACEAVLEGYSHALREEGTPIVLAERHRWLRDLAAGHLKEQRAYWDQLLRLAPLARGAPAEVRKLLRAALPERDLTLRIVHRQAGMGSLGRERFTALADWRGGTIAREAKPLTASAWTWACGGPVRALLYERILRGAVRVPDPFLSVHGNWVIRRLAPDCTRIELARVGTQSDSCKLLWTMGWETANIHLGTPAGCKLIRRDLGRRQGNWLLEAARSMRAATLADWRAWRVTGLH